MQQTDADANRGHDATDHFYTTRQRPEYNAGVTSESSQTTNDAMLHRLVEHLRTTDERSVQMASQIDRLNKALVTVLELGVLHTNPVTPAQAPPVTLGQPPAVTPQFRARRNGPPGTFREPVPDTKHKSLKETQFHVSSRLSDKFQVD